MFGYVGSGGRIEKVGVENVNITGNVGVGGLVGRNSGTVENSYATGSVSSDGFNVGGLVGDGRLGTVKKSYATGDVSGDSNVGGLVGNGGTVEKSYATGSVSGGRNVGGLVGQDAALTVTGSYYDTETTGQSSSEGGTGLTTSEMTGSAATSNMDAFDFTSTWETESDDYPILTWQTDGNGNTIDSASNGDGERNGGTDGGNVGSNGADGENTAENSSGTEGSEGLPGFTVVTAAIALLTVAAAAVRRRME
jgi:PGF-CTERM protein